VGGRQTLKTWCHLLRVGGPQTPTTVAHQVPGAASRLVRTPEETSRSQNFRALRALGGFLERTRKSEVACSRSFTVYT
jgi:hypothetical protein